MTIWHQQQVKHVLQYIILTISKSLLYYKDLLFWHSWLRFNSHPVYPDLHDNCKFKCVILDSSIGSRPAGFYNGNFNPTKRFNSDVRIIIDFIFG